MPLPHIKHAQCLWPCFTFFPDPVPGVVLSACPSNRWRDQVPHLRWAGSARPNHMPVSGHVVLPVVPMTLVNMSTGFQRSILSTIQSRHMGAQDGAGKGDHGHHRPAELLAQEALNTRQHLFYQQLYIHKHHSPKFRL